MWRQQLKRKKDIWTEVFPCFFLSCKVNARVNPAKMGHGSHSSNVFVLFYVLFVLVLFYIVCFVSFCVLFVCECVLYYCHRLATHLHLRIISYHILYLIVSKLRNMRITLNSGGYNIYSLFQFNIFLDWIK
jgi:uncharacterized membrane protein